MTKTEFYKKVLSVYKETGQGTPMFVADKLGIRYLVDEMVQDGLLQIVTNHYSYLPDDVTICLTDVYCVEKEMAKGNGRALDFVRRYLGLPGNSVLDQKVEEFFQKNPQEREKYDNEYLEWLEENKEILEKSFQKEPIEIDEDSSLDRDTISFLKERAWYKNNLTVEESLRKSNEANSLEKQKLSLIKQLNGLYKADPKYIKELEKNEKELVEVETELKLRARLTNVMTSCKDKSIKVQEVFNDRLS